MASDAQQAGDRHLTLTGADAVRHARANARAEGIEFSAPFEDILASVASGEQTPDAAITAVLARYSERD